MSTAVPANWYNVVEYHPLLGAPLTTTRGQSGQDAPPLSSLRKIEPFGAPRPSRGRPLARSLPPAGTCLAWRKADFEVTGRRTERCYRTWDPQGRAVERGTRRNRVIEDQRAGRGHTWDDTEHRRAEQSHQAETSHTIPPVHVRRSPFFAGRHSLRLCRSRYTRFAHLHFVRRLHLPRESFCVQREDTHFEGSRNRLFDVFFSTSFALGR